VADLHSSILPLENRGTRVDLKALSSIAGACREKVILRFRYAGKDAEPGMRSVEPHRLVHTGWRWYLAAWDLNRKDWRTFRVDRMGGKFSTGAHFKLRPAPDGDFAAYVSRSVSFTRFPRQARVTLHAPLELIAKKLPPGAGTLESIDEQRCRLQTGARSLEMIAVGLALLGVDFEVHDPPELTELMLRMAERLHNAAKRRADA
jgi:predicted DNA-binding transcriptional regulator YafY